MRNLSAERRRAARAGDEREARSGLLIAAALHAGVIVAAIFGGPIFSSDEAQAIRIAQVDLVSGASFDAMISSAPEGPRGDLPSLAPPSEGPESPAPEALAPEAPQRTDVAPAAAPERSEPVAADASAPPPQDRPDIAPARPEAPPTPDAPLSPTQGIVAQGVPLPAGPDRPDTPQRDAPVPVETAPPRDIDRVAPSPTPPSPLVAQADDPVPAVSSDAAEAPETPTPPDQPPAAPEAATTQIVTEADETSERDAPAPVASALPVGRPDVIPPEAAPERSDSESPPERVAAAEPERAPAPQPETERQQTAQAPAAPAPTSPSNAPRGRTLTRGEIEGIRARFENAWRPSPLLGLERYKELVVVLRVQLDRSGKIVGRPTVIAPNPVPDGRWQRAIDVAMRAVGRISRESFELPVESYGDWREMDLVFDPSKGLQWGGGT
ncbi:MAG: hypothetical protein AAF676_03065 [Pseudomonadota bacterium]